MAVSCEFFGKTKNGEEVLKYRISNSAGAYAEILNMGGVLRSLCVPDRNGQLVDVVLGFDSVKEYEEDPEYVGALVGRVANRIAGSRFTLNGKEYSMTPMENGNSIHGGVVGYSFRIWQVQAEDDRLILTLHSYDGEEGFPGNLDVEVIYTFSDDCCLRLDYRAAGDADTIVNLTNHAYFNLAGEGNVLDQNLRICADSFTEMDETFLTTGRILPVDGTPFDFRTFKEIGKDLFADSCDLKNGMGYDHNFVLTREENCAEAYSDKTGIRLKLSTDLPGIQFYSGNSLPDRPGKDGKQTSVHAGFCLETQFFPDSVHHENFPSIVLKAGEEWKHYARFQFGNKE